MGKKRERSLKAKEQFRLKAREIMFDGSMFIPKCEGQLFLTRLARLAKRDYGNVVVSLGGQPVMVNAIDSISMRLITRLAIERIRAEGFTWETSIAECFSLMFILGPNFLRHELTMRYTQKPTLPLDLRVARFVQEAKESELLKIREDCISDDWKTTGF